jgi:hypothetical protein
VCCSLLYAGVILVPPMIHSTSSCSWGWGQVGCRSLCLAYRHPPSPPSLVGPSPCRFLAVPPIHPASRGSQQWWVVWLLRCALLVRHLCIVHILVIIPPVFHPTSSCLWGWGRVVCCPSSLVPLCPRRGPFHVGSHRFSCWCVGLGRFVLVAIISGSSDCKNSSIYIELVVKTRNEQKNLPRAQMT